MIINIDKLPEEGLKICKDFEYCSTDLVEENATFLESVHADVSVKKTGEEVFVKGRITTSLRVVCSRCLIPFEFPVDSRFDLVYLPEEMYVVKEQLEVEDLDQSFYFNRIIDIKKEILEQLNLAFPVKPLCSKDCQGICPVCGKIIEEGGCSCAANESDPRLAKFKIFMRDKR